MVYLNKWCDAILSVCIVLGGMDGTLGPRALLGRCLWNSILSQLLESGNRGVTPVHVLSQHSQYDGVAVFVPSETAEALSLGRTAPAYK
jgi:hypothetical protein